MKPSIPTKKERPATLGLSRKSLEKRNRYAVLLDKLCLEIVESKPVVFLATIRLEHINIWVRACCDWLDNVY